MYKNKLRLSGSKRRQKGASMSISSFTIFSKLLYIAQAAMFVWFIAALVAPSLVNYVEIPIIFLVSTLPINVGFYLGSRYGNSSADSSATWMEVSNYNNLNNINKKL
jgi:hypothetical protein